MHYEASGGTSKTKRFHVYRIGDGNTKLETVAANLPTYELARKVAEACNQAYAAGQEHVRALLRRALGDG